LQGLDRGGVALGGFMGTGKTTVGRLIAGALGLPFVDVDEELVRRFGPIAKQFHEVGEAGFRARERAVVAEVARAGRAVIATGGGAWVDPANREALGRHGARVVLQAPLDVIRARIGQGADRPLASADLEALLASRQEAYADADLQVDTSTRSAAEIAGAIVAWLRGRPTAAATEVVRVELGERAYPVVVAAGLAGLGAALRERFGAARLRVVTDDRVAPLWLGALQAELARAELAAEVLVIPAGEEHKHRDTWWSIVDGLLRAGVDRRSLVLALGGGVVGDMTGFAAASVARGLDWVQVPTTLLAMVDASVGGKTGFNHPLGKNLVGAFHQPRLVWTALETLGTLPERERRAALAEVVKHALIEDAGWLADLEAQAGALARGDAEVVRAAVLRCVRSKARVVAADEREQGGREVLNLGHTVGHAIEAVTGFSTWLHGEAVAIGLVAELRWTERSGLAEEGCAARVEALLRALGLPVTVDCETAQIVAAMGLDKKAHGAMLKLPVCVRPGVVRVISIPRDDLTGLVEGRI
jgi:shikimate kinase/3-dehydroquinate synthase